VASAATASDGWFSICYKQMKGAKGSEWSGSVKWDRVKDVKASRISFFDSLDKSLDLVMILLSITFNTTADVHSHHLCALIS
jgi:hypothetical protein